MRSISKRIAWLSLLMTLWSALAFAMHHHSDVNESAACQVCIASAFSNASNRLPYTQAGISTLGDIPSTDSRSEAMPDSVRLVCPPASWRLKRSHFN